MIDMEKIFTYLDDLQQNNNREWYLSHKKERQDANHEFERLIYELLLRINDFDDSIPICSPKELTFKQVRDIRFSKDKTPYNPTFRAHMAPKGKLPIPVGYFLSLKPFNQTLLGGGLFADMFKDATSMIREYISTHEQAFNHILTEHNFCSHFTVLGTKLKRVPIGYDPDLSVSEYLKHKSWYVEHNLSGAELLDSSTFIRLAVEKFKYMRAFNSFLNEALINFQMPMRK